MKNCQEPVVPLRECVSTGLWTPESQYLNNNKQRNPGPQVELMSRGPCAPWRHELLLRTCCGVLQLKCNKIYQVNMVLSATRVPCTAHIWKSLKQQFRRTDTTALQPSRTLKDPQIHHPLHHYKYTIILKRGWVELVRGFSNGWVDVTWRCI